MSEPDGRSELARLLAERRAECPRCGYELHGLRDEHCPECGTRLALGVVSREAAPPVRVTFTLFGLLAGGPFLVTIVAFLQSAMAGFRSGFTIDFDPIHSVVALVSSVVTAPLLVLVLVRPRLVARHHAWLMPLLIVLATAILITFAMID